MAKRLLVQRKGKGSIFRAKKKGVFKTDYIGVDKYKESGKILGEVISFVHDSTNTAPLAQILFENDITAYTIAAEGLVKGQKIEFGEKAAIEIGNVITLGKCVEGSPIFNIEKNPGDGGSFVRSSGGYGLIVTKDKKKVFVKLPSGKTVPLKHDCRATIGMAAGGGRPEKPLVKAGRNFLLRKAKRKKYPVVRGVAMNPNAHPFGGAQHHPGKSKSTSRHAPPGRKVGSIASKRTGRVKK